MAAEIVGCPGCGTRNRVPAVAKGKPACSQCKTVLPWKAKANDDNFDEVADSAKVAVLVDLWAPWCGPCRQVSPILDKIVQERAGKLKLVKVNVDDNPVVSQRFSVQSIPMMLLFKNGKQVGTQRGALPLAQLQRWVDANI